MIPAWSSQRWYQAPEGTPPSLAGDGDSNCSDSLSWGCVQTDTQTVSHSQVPDHEIVKVFDRRPAPGPGRQTLQLEISCADNLQLCDAPLHDLLMAATSTNTNSNSEKKTDVKCMTSTCSDLEATLSATEDECSESSSLMQDDLIKGLGFPILFQTSIEQVEDCSFVGVPLAGCGSDPFQDVLQLKPVSAEDVEKLTRIRMPSYPASDCSSNPSTPVSVQSNPSQPASVNSNPSHPASAQSILSLCDSSADLSPETISITDDEDSDDELEKKHMPALSKTSGTEDEEDTYHCLLCRKEFSQQDDLHLHINTVHNSNECHSCPQCGKLFTRTASLRAHMDMHSHELSLELTKDLGKGDRKKPGPKPGAKPSHISHSSKTDGGTSHSSKHENKPSTNFESTKSNYLCPLMCTFCNKSFKTQQGLCQHVAENHAIFKKASPPKNKTKNEHRKHTKSLNCAKCSQKFKTQEKLDKHIEWAHKHIEQALSPEENTCKVCGNSFSSKSNMLRHAALAHKTRDRSKSGSREPSTGKLRRNSELSPAILRKSRKPSTESCVEEKSLSSADWFSCELCGCHFNRLAAFKAHKKVHENEDAKGHKNMKSRCTDADSCKSCDKLVCQYCCDCFPDVAHLRDHFQKHHKKEKSQTSCNLKCPMCNETYCNPSKFQQHLNKHDMEMPDPQIVDRINSERRTRAGETECPRCEKTFNGWQALNEHFLEHDLGTTSDDDLYVWDNCGKDNCDKAASTPHNQQEHGPTSKKLSCQVCHKSFTFQHNLLLHLKTKHASEFSEQNKCKQCLAEFLTNSQLEEHCKQRHKTRSVSPIPEKSESLPTSENMLVLAPPCVICSELGRNLHKTQPAKSKSCPACSQFFVENLQLLLLSGKLKCDYNGKCLIAKETMETCPPCHLRLCMLTFPILQKVEAESLKNLDIASLNHIMQTLSNQCLHQTSCNKFIKAFNDLASVKNIPKSSMLCNTSSSHNKEILGKRPSVPSQDNANIKVPKVEPKTEPQDNKIMLHVDVDDGEDDDVIFIGDDDLAIESVELVGDLSSSNLLLDTANVVSPFYDMDDEAANVKSETVEATRTADEATDHKSLTNESQPRLVARKRTAGKSRVKYCTDSESESSTGRRDSEDTSSLYDSTESIARHDSIGSTGCHDSTETSESSSSTESGQHLSKHLGSRSTLGGDTSHSSSDHKALYEKSRLPLKEFYAELHEKMAEWARPCFWMWTVVAFNLSRLQEYNRAQAAPRPHCCICKVFCSNESKCPVPRVVEAQQGLIFKMSEPSIPESLFRSSPFKSTKTKQPKTNVKEEPQGQTVLVTCSICNVCVHAKCYGIDMDETLADWKCVMCSQDMSNAECSLCFMRGGALQPTTDGHWCHIVCALVIPEVFFVNVEARRPINIRHISNDRKKLRCRNCIGWMKDVPRSGACAQCWDSAKCCAPLHVTCGQAAGDKFEARHDDSRIPVYVTCRRHLQKSKKNVRVKMPKVEIGQEVIAKAKNGRYYCAKVIKQSLEIFYEVDFPDGSVSKDLYPQDILNRDCKEYGPPPEGASVEVIWPDHKKYPGIFRGVNSSVVYQVQFEDHSTVKLKREQIYAAGEHLPDSVRKKMSRATESRFDFDVVFAQAPTQPRPRCSNYEC